MLLVAEPFRPILDAIRVLINSCNSVATAPVDSRSSEELDLDESHAELKRLIDRQLAVGLPAFNTSYPGGKAGWEFDVGDSFKQLLRCASELIEVAKKAPSVFDLASDPEATKRWSEGQDRLRDSEERLLSRQQEVLKLQQQVPPIPIITGPEPAKNEKEKERSPTEKLNHTEHAVLSVIENQPEGEGMSAKKILAQLKKQKITIAESTLRKHILPILREFHHVVNHRAAGGYLIRKQM